MSTLSRRALGRATLARQLLLERSPSAPVAAVQHLVGLQAQTPQSWYGALWSRVAGFDPAHVSAALEQRDLVRVPLMRSTIHLVTAADALALRPLVDVVIERSTMGVFGRRLGDVDRSALVAAARELVEERPMIASELGRALAERFPGPDAEALAQGARAWLPMVQVPPRGLWGQPGRPLQAPLDTWLGRPLAAAPIADVVRRYLGAFGPATVRDVQLWCGLTKLTEVLDALRPSLLAFRDGDGGELFDLPDAPRPAADTPAPVRFLPDFDNLLLSHADRSRVVDVDYGTQGFGATSNIQPGSVLVDGTVGATWRVEKAAGAATLTVRPFRALTPAEATDVTAEGLALLRFLHPRAEHDLHLHPAS